MTWRDVITVYLLLLMVMSVITFITFAADKRRARRGGWRVSEKTLHVLELLGGWPGAWLAMRWLRHKSIKRRYRAVFVLIVSLHVLACLIAWFVWASGPE